MILVGNSSASQKDGLEINNKTKNIYQTKMNVLAKSPRKIMAKPDLKQHQSSSKAGVHFIDFGLGYISKKIEDKAVDLHLLKQSLEAKHFKNWEFLLKEVLKEYENVLGKEESKKVFERTLAVEKRGRYRH